jgi:hypothetical protein
MGLRLSCYFLPVDEAIEKRSSSFIPNGVFRHQPWSNQSMPGQTESAVLHGGLAPQGLRITGLLSYKLKLHVASLHCRPPADSIRLQKIRADRPSVFERNEFEHHDLVMV